MFWQLAGWLHKRTSQKIAWVAEEADKEVFLLLDLMDASGLGATRNHGWQASGPWFVETKEGKLTAWMSSTTGRDPVTSILGDRTRRKRKL